MLLTNFHAGSAPPFFSFFQALARHQRKQAVAHASLVPRDPVRHVAVVRHHAARHPLGRQQLAAPPPPPPPPAVSEVDPFWRLRAAQHKHHARQRQGRRACGRAANRLQRAQQRRLRLSRPLYCLR